jgi:talin
MQIERFERERNAEWLMSTFLFAVLVCDVTVIALCSRRQLQKLPPAKCNIVQARTLLRDRATELNQAASEIASAAAGSMPSQQLAPALHRFSRAYEEFVDCGLETTSAAAAAGDAATQSEVVSGLRGVSTVASRLLIAAKSVLVNPNAPDVRNQLTVAARFVLCSTFARRLSA